MAGGGTGGHIIPALAVAGELRSRGHQIFFLGTKPGMEARLVPAAGFDLEWIDIGGLNSVGLLRKLRTLWQLPVSVWKVWRLLGRRRPAAMFSMGGYVAGPAVLAAVLRGVPLVAMEPNAVPGMTTRRMARWTHRSLVNFEETVRYFKPGKAEVSGVPVRQAFFAVQPKPPGGPFTILITGGSQGSRTLNEAARGAWARLSESGVRLVQQTGRAQFDEYRAGFKSSGVQGEVVPFIEDMPQAFADADLVVCRSGASTVSELAAARRASILIPFPFAADDHQKRNAQAMVRAGAARMVLDGEFNADRLIREAMELAGDISLLRKMEVAAGALAKPDAARRAAQVLEEAVR